MTMATGRRTKKGSKLSNVFDHFTKREIEKMTEEKKDRWNRFFEKGGKIEKLPSHITKDMLERWKF